MRNEGDKGWRHSTYIRYLWTLPMIIFLTCGKEKENLVGPDGTVDLSGLYVFITEIISNTCNFVS